LTGIDLLAAMQELPGVKKNDADIPVATEDESQEEKPVEGEKAS
jgi:hypothetical protein